jgi:hypothetical protein
MRNFVIMTDQLKIDAMKSVAMILRPAHVDSWKAKSSPSEARNCGNSSGTINADHSRGRRAAGKILTGALVFFTLLPARAAEGPVYDVFGRALAPIAAAVLGGGDGATGAMVAECRVTGGSGPLQAAQGTRFRLAVQSPDRLRVDVVREGQVLTACRDGNEVWATPADAMRVLLGAAGLDLSSEPSGTTAPPLMPLALDPRMLAFLPAVFDVQDEGMDEQRRVLEFGLLPQLRDAISAADFRGRAWIGEDYRPSRLSLTLEGQTLDLEIDQLEFPAELTAGAWQPAAGADVLRLPASAINDIVDSMLGGTPVR